MSRHRRQRNKRFRKAINNLDESRLDIGYSSLTFTDKFKKWLSPLERIVILKQYRKER